MSINIIITGLIFLMVQAVMFGIGTIVILETSLAPDAMTLMPWMIGLSFLVSVPLSAFLAPHLRARFEPVSPQPGE